MTFALIIIFYFYPHAMEHSIENNHSDGFEVTSGYAVWMLDIARIFLYVEIALFFSAVVETDFLESKSHFYNKFFQAIPTWLYKIHTILLIIGIVCSLIPVGLSIISFF